MNWRRAVRVVWDGPFWIGPLTRPITFGEVAMKLLETLWRMAFVIACVAVVILAVGVWIEAHPAAVPAMLEDQVELTAAYGRGCSAAYPIAVSEVNRSETSIGRVDFTMAVHAATRTTDLGGSPSYFNDTIVRPHYRARACFARPFLPLDIDPSAMVYEPTIVRVERYNGPLPGSPPTVELPVNVPATP